MNGKTQGDPYGVWLITLAGLLCPADPGSLKEGLNVLRPHLRAEISPAYLTPESARLVAAAERFGPIPDWAVMRKTLRNYIATVRPVTYGCLPAPREPDYPKPTEDEIRRVGDLLKNWLVEKGDGSSP